LTQDEEELMMNLSPIYQQRCQDWRQEGLQEGLQGQREIIKSLLQERFGWLDDELLALVDRLLTHPAHHYTRLLLQASREEILAQFPPL
jgi:hypothetical protein